MSPRTFVLALMLGSASFAQCGMDSIAFSQYGVGCSGFGQAPPSLTGFYVHGSCQVTITLSGATEACPDFCLVERLIAVGVTPTQIPLGVVSCDLLVVPAFIVSIPAGAGNDFVFNLPPFSIAGLQVYVHGGNVFMTPAGPVYEVANGLHLDYF